MQVFPLDPIDRVNITEWGCILLLAHTAWRPVDTNNRKKRDRRTLSYAEFAIKRNSLCRRDPLHTSIQVDELQKCLQSILFIFLYELTLLRFIVLM